MALADSQTFWYTLKVFWYIRKNIELDNAINYVCCWLFSLSVKYSKPKKHANPLIFRCQDNFLAHLLRQVINDTSFDKRSNLRNIVNHRREMV